MINPGVLLSAFTINQIAGEIATNQRSLQPLVLQQVHTSVMDSVSSAKRLSQQEELCHRELPVVSHFFTMESLIIRALQLLILSHGVQWTVNTNLIQKIGATAELFLPQLLHLCQSGTIVAFQVTLCGPLVAQLLKEVLVVFHFLTKEEGMEHVPWLNMTKCGVQ